MANYLLGLETTCDETAAAVFDDQGTILSNIVASQESVHAKYGGVVPEIASREHLRNILPVIEESISSAGISLDQLDAVAVAYKPGLIGAILIGLSAAKTLAMMLDIPLIGIDHLQAHIYAAQIGLEESIFPSVGFVVSGGHTNLFLCKSAIEFEPIGSTTDDAAGEAFDKVAKILQLGYPGGPAIEKAAQNGDPKAFRFPRTFLDDDRLAFSFSGIKTAVLYSVHGSNNKSSDRILNEQEQSDYAASFQQAMIDVLVEKCRQAVVKMQTKNLCVGGGVTANSLFRKSLQEMCRQNGWNLYLADPKLCTDNAAMAAIAVEHFKSGQFSNLDLEAVAGLVRSS